MSISDHYQLVFTKRLFFRPAEKLFLSYCYD
jgi:hypothetical protein